MVGKLTQDDKNALNDFLRDVKDFIISPLTPELLKDGVQRIKEINANGDKKISRDEANTYLSAHMGTPSPDLLLNVLRQIAKERKDEDCNIIALHTHIPKPEKIIAKETALVNINDPGMNSVGITQGIAELLNMPDDKNKQAFMDKFSNVALEMIENKIYVPPDYKQETSEYIKPKIQEIGKKAIQKIEGLLKDNPGIKQALLNLPDTSELNITADHVCQVMTGPYTPKNTQTTKINR
jgi:hypothetical protein